MRSMENQQDKVLKQSNHQWIGSIVKTVPIDNLVVEMDIVGLNADHLCIIRLLDIAIVVHPAHQANPILVAGLIESARTIRRDFQL